jgi:hypothetical protein
VNAFVTAGAGFLLSVLWFDLMFDVQVLPHRRRGAEVPEGVLASIAAYYARVTTAAHPMNRLVAAVMLSTGAAVIVEIADDSGPPRWAAWASLVLVVCAVGLAATSTVPRAVRLGTRADPPEVQGDLARRVLTDHLLCFALIASLLTLQLVTT